LESINVSKRYNGSHVLKDISFGIAEGESIAITGASGSGKSTLLSIMGLLLDPSQGEILFQGQRTSDLSDDKRSQIRNSFFGFVFQNPQLIGSLSVLDNVLVPAFLARRKDLRAKAESILERLGMERRFKYLPYQLSIGQRRRVAIARALLLDPVLILADEPTNDLDAARADLVGQILAEFPKEGNSLLLVTHDPNLSRRAHRILQIDESTLLELS
jgi:putative ABC transport system ATP-binding protein